ncbi:MAG: site-specific integrase, partial [Candidatus Obscuribacterales bacterium]|nr:site-specific integrase [Candidatus Obscuribacterales bacterium]
KFTKKRLQDLPPAVESKQDYFGDSETRGLEISVTRSGAKSFFFRRKVEGVTRRMWLGYFPDTSVDQARGRAAELNGQVSRGINVFAKGAADKNELTLQAIFDEYIERHAKKSRKTWQEMTKSFDRAFEGGVSRSSAHSVDLRKKKVSEISHAMAESLHADVAKKRGQYAANRLVQILRAVYNKAKVWKLYEGDNPFNGITLYQEKPRDRFLSKEEAITLLSQLETEADDTLRDFIKLSLFTGIRKANLMAMRWQDIDLESGLLTIPDTKNNTKQDLVLGGHEIALLKERRRRMKAEGILTQFVFPGSGSTGHLMDLKKSWTTFRKRAGFTGDKSVTIHDLRRSLGAAMANANINIALVKAALHHKDMKTTVRVYAHTQQEAVRDARQLAHEAWLKVEDDSE